MSGVSGNVTPVGCQFALDYLSGTMTTTLVPGASARSTYLMLLTAAPSNPSSMATYSEVAAAGYARQSVTWSAAVVGPASEYQVSNSASVLFGPFTGSSGIGPPATMCALVTVLTGISGTPLMLWTLDSAGNAAQNASLQFAAGALIMALA